MTPIPIQNIKPKPKPNTTYLPLVTNQVPILFIAVNKRPAHHIMDIYNRGHRANPTLRGIQEPPTCTLSMDLMERQQEEDGDLVLPRAVTRSGPGGRSFRACRPPFDEPATHVLGSRGSFRGRGGYVVRDCWWLGGGLLTVQKQVAFVGSYQWFCRPRRRVSSLCVRVHVRQSHGLQVTFWAQSHAEVMGNKEAKPLQMSWAYRFSSLRKYSRFLALLKGRTTYRCSNTILRLF